MALAVAATGVCRAAASTRYADAGVKVKAAAAAAAARCSKPTAACKVLGPGSSRYTTSSQCHSSSRSRYGSSSRSGSSSSRRHCSGSSPVAGGAAPRRAGHLSKLQQEQQQRRMNSSACATLFLSASCATHQGTAVREEIARQTPGAAAQRACSLPPAGAAAPAPWAAERSPPTAARRRAAAAWSGKTAGLLPAAAAPAGEEEAADTAASWTGGRSIVSLAAKLRPAVVTATPEESTFERSTAAKTGFRRSQTPCQQISRLSSATEMQRVCKISTSEVLQTADKKLLLQPLYFLLAHLRCTYTALRAEAPLGRTHKASLSTSFTNRVSAVATLLPSPKEQQRRLPLPHTAAAACPPRVAGTAVAPLHVVSRRRLSCSAAVAVRGKPPIVAAFGPAAAAGWNFAPRPVVSPLLKFAAALRSSQAAGSLPVALLARGASASLPTVWQCGAARRSVTACASASGAAAAASAVAPPPRSARGGSRATGAAAAGSKKTVAALPLGSLYSKTHEYVHLLLEFVGPTDVEAGAVAAGERKGRVDAPTGRSPRPRHCQLVGFVGLSAHAAEDLGEVVYCEYTRPLAAAAAAAAAAAEAGGAEAAAQRPPQRGRADRDSLAEEAREEEAAGAEQEKMWVRRGSPVCSLESVKSVAEVYSPVEGIVLAINPAATKEPALVWRDSEGDGWLVKLLLPLPAGKTSDSDDEVCSAYALHLTDADLAAAAAAEATAAGASLGTAPAAEPKLAAGAAAGGGPAAAEAAAASEAEEETYKFMQACRDCQRLQDALRGLRRRLMGPEQYTQFVEREKQAAGAET